MLKALAIEDGEDIKQLLRDELEDKGYQVIEACNGEIGLEQATAEIPNIIFADVYMPIMNGLEFIEHLRLNAGQIRISSTSIFWESEEW